MFYWQTLWFLVCLSVLNVALASEGEHDARFKEIAFRHVLFEQYQDNHRAAYVVADYYERRGLSSESIKLTRAAASLELGYLDHGRALVADLEQSSLLPRNQARLRLYLARDAYHRRDWVMLEEHLQLLSNQTLESYYDQNMQVYLQIELASQQRQFEAIDRYLSAMDEDFRLRPHALFNVAVAVSEEDEPAAITLLESLLALKPQDLAGFTLRDRARVALAEIYIGQGEWASARDSLVRVSANHRYGPYALAQIARLDMQGARYEDAAAIWQYLNQEHTWHRASTHAVSGLGYSLQQSRGDEAAFVVYSEGLQDMAQHQQRLWLAGERISNELQNPDLFSETSESFLLWMSDTLGNDDWLDWLASTEIRTLVSRWQALSLAHEKLVGDGENLTSLLEVDGEQQRRIAKANDVIQQGELAGQLIGLKDELQRYRDELIETKFTFDDDLSTFADSEQSSLNQEIARLRAQFLELPAADAEVARREDILSRLDRLEGLVRYDIFHQLPRQRQQLISHYDAYLQMAEASERRLNRIVGAATRQPESISVRIEELALKRLLLEKETQLALSGARHQVLASLDQLILRDQERLQIQMAGLQYDVTRLADRRLASEGAP